VFLIQFQDFIRQGYFRFPINSYLLTAGIMQAPSALRVAGIER